MPEDNFQRPVLKKRELINLIQNLSSFSTPKLHWEQYSTDAVATADLFYYIAFEQQDLGNQLLIDFGCGPGHLTVAGIFLGARHVLGIDIDPEALEICAQNLEKLQIRNRVSLLHGDLTQTPIIPKIREQLATIGSHTSPNTKIIGVSNPPFGVHNKGVDIQFVRQALQVVDVLYSIHLQSAKVRSFLARKIPQLGGTITNMGSLSMVLPHSYHHHHHKRKTIQTDVYRIVPHASSS